MFTTLHYFNFSEDINFIAQPITKEINISMENGLTWGGESSSAVYTATAERDFIITTKWF